MKEKREMVPVPVRRRETEREKEKKVILPEEQPVKPREMPRRWYVY